jgi:hypothetical protein
MNHYASANLSVYSGSTGDFTTFMFAGITANTFDPQSGAEAKFFASPGLAANAMF